MLGNLDIDSTLHYVFLHSINMVILCTLFHVKEQAGVEHPADQSLWLNIKIRGKSLCLKEWYEKRNNISHWYNRSY